MSWLRIEGRMPHHRKVAPLSDEAFRLHVTAMAWCVDECPSGTVPGNIPATLPAAPRGRRLARVLDELLSAGLWERTETGAFVIHDFLVYNPSAAQREAVHAAKVAAGQAGGLARASRRHSKTLAAASPSASSALAESLAESLAEPKQGPRARPDPDPRSETESPPAEDLSGLTRVRSTGGQAGGLSGDFSERIQTRPRVPGQPPPPRHDPLGERISFDRWWPDAQWLAWFAEIGLTDSAYEKTRIEAKDKLLGRHEIDWWDTKLVAFFEVAVRPKKAPGELEHEARKAEAKATDAALLAEARAGKYGAKVQRDVEAGRLTAAVLRALLEERQQERSAGAA